MNLSVREVDGLQQVFFKNIMIEPSHFTLRYNRSNFLRSVGEKENFSSAKREYSKSLNFKHAENKAIGDILGVNEAIFKKHYNALMYKVLCANYGKEVLNLCYNGYGLKYVLLHRVISNYDKIKQVQKNGLHNLVPVVMMTGKTPFELKQEMKAHVWKNITRNTKNRNKLIFAPLAYSSSMEDICYRVNIPSTILEYCPRVEEKLAIFIVKEMKGNYKNRKMFRELLNLARDADFALRNIGKEINPNWSIRRVKEEHDKAIKEYNAKIYSNDNFMWSENIKKEYTIGNFKATFLNSKADIANEGQEMHHCVAFYAEESSQGKYVVFSITENGNRYSTLGLTRNIITGKVQFQQHYKKCNAEVDSGEAVELSKIIIEDINNGA